MENFISYLIEASIILGILTLFYRFVLHYEPLFKFNRFFLLFSLLLASTIPLVHISFYTVNTETSNIVVLLDSVNVFSEDMRKMVVPVIAENKSFAWLYWIGSIFLVTRLLWSIIQLGGLSQKATWHKYKGLRIADLSGKFNPFSFFHIIFINRSRYSDDDLNKIMVHEMAHIKHRHSLDVLLFETLLIVQWFNPFAWLIKILLKELHEFQADHSVLQKGTTIGSYKKLLLCQATGAQLLPVNNFNQSITKKRFKMMTNKILTNKALVKTITAILMIAGVGFFFACDNELSSDIENTEDILSLKSTSNNNSYILGDSTRVYFITDSIPKFPGGDQAIREFIAQKVKYPVYAQENNIQGNVYVKFIVDEEGYVTDVNIARGVHQSIDEEALRVVSSMPQWKPGIHKGKAVKVSYTIPINFKLQINDNSESNLMDENTLKDIDPLVILDGKKITKAELIKISNENIASINILKDKQATQKYGVEGKNGVILIQSKESSSNKSTPVKTEEVHATGYEK
ncbi:M56 family metallopeptidase [Saccharicrinis fermentans]|uniref:TonB C-terminal domain-containing protein n=1 Tax=Saccharicrinis fermentans DSM 9555 = JCM 21142 TaxID=869213 RepID=W7YJ21_9BACT|nr:M56 family metallopeptidase [Saccharicrinis fermentans]GAF04486.1 hypothetical protein JCM21142_83194 [Saccharicrinis fermentans DSM 9555 = JCM 21142]